MNAREKERLSNEISMQQFALKRISLWRIFAVALSAVGVIMAYIGFSGMAGKLLLAIPGVLLMALGFSAALICNKGIKNGSANVNRMMAALENAGAEPAVR